VKRLQMYRSFFELGSRSLVSCVLLVLREASSSRFKAAIFDQEAMLEPLCGSVPKNTILPNLLWRSM